MSVPNEQNLVDDFIKNCIPNLCNKITIGKSTVSVNSTNCDIDFYAILNGATNPVHYCLEAKSDKSTNKTNNALMLFGDILKNRKIHGGSKNTFGVFLEYHESIAMNSYFIKRLQKEITSDDWNLFGEKFGCEVIFFYDDVTHHLFYSGWKDFINCTSLHQWK